MKKTKRLGRGLEDISHYFISRNQTITDKYSHPVQSVALQQYKTISIVDLFDPQRGAFLTARVGMELSQKGIRVLLVDADLRFPGIALVLGVSLPGYSFEHYYQERYQPDDVLGTGPYGLKLLAPHLTPGTANLQHQAEMFLMLETLISTEKETDLVIIRQFDDSINPIIDEALFVVPVSDSSLPDSYKAMKKFSIGDDRKMTGILAAETEEEAAAIAVFENISNCAEMSYGVRPYFLGNLTDGHGEGSTLNPSCISNIVSRLTEIALHNREMTGNKRLFFERFRLLSGGDVVTPEEMKYLAAAGNSCESTIPDSDLYFY